MSGLKSYGDDIRAASQASQSLAEVAPVIGQAVGVLIALQAACLIVLTWLAVRKG